MPVRFECRIGRAELYWSLTWHRLKPQRMANVAAAQGYGEGEVMDEDPARPSLQQEEWASVPVLQQRADELLRSVLTAQQQSDLQTHGWFEVMGNLGHHYRIKQGATRNVLQLGDDGQVIRSLCAGPESVPVGDVMLAQKLLLETDELAFAFIARTFVEPVR